MILLGKIVLSLVVIFGLTVIEELIRQGPGITYQAPTFWRGVAFTFVQSLSIALILILVLYLFS